MKEKNERNVNDASEHDGCFTFATVRFSVPVNLLLIAMLIDCSFCVFLSGSLHAVIGFFSVFFVAVFSVALLVHLVLNCFISSIEYGKMVSGRSSSPRARLLTLL